MSPQKPVTKRNDHEDHNNHGLHQYQDTDGHFSLVRNFRLADLVTIMNGVCGSFSIFSSANYLLTNDPDYLWSAMAFPLAGLMFDFLDGKVARWRKSTSMLGQELDSLADLISFGVAPSLLAFVIGLRTYLDTVILTGFICCGLARLARFNATVALVPKNEGGKAKYFEGLPIPSSLALLEAANEALNIRTSKKEEDWQNYVTHINATIDKLDLEFRSIHDELSGREMYALVNRKGDEIAQMATDYTPVEIAFFKAVVEQIMLAPHESYSVSSLAALRELTAAKLSMSKSQAEIVLASFVSKGWLLKSVRGRYSLSTRSLLELFPYLKSTYPEEILECTVCFEILTRGIACTTKNCKVRMHFHCFTTYRRRHQACPTCTTGWAVEKEKFLRVGEEAARGDEKRRVRVRSAEPSEEEEEEEEEPPTQDTLPKKAKRRLTKGKARADSMEVEAEEDAEEPSQPSQTQVSQRNRRSSRR
ncbi:unnamed protein product [Cyclocybe aegerita]|uniref:Non-structural maintenance of chromosomes element 1 homolog n=1 Tax=Cyclocybe aegerita TaxID=1973307 RepID=A0A8S0Y162_CYCAE|nr:unnamed protein product [Cyclocybe aegerita]